MSEENFESRLAKETAALRFQLQALRAEMETARLQGIEECIDAIETVGKRISNWNEHGATYIVLAARLRSDFGLEQKNVDLDEEW